MSTSLDDLAELPIWCARGKEAARKRAPINARTGGWAKSDTPATWSKRQAAESRAASYDPAIAGVGLMLGPHGAPNGYVLAGLDLDGCFEDSTIAPWAETIRLRFQTYCEFSPSGGGLRLLFFAAKSDVDSLRADGLFENLGKQFAKPGHIEIATYFGKRYVSITDLIVGDPMVDAEDRIQEIGLDDLRWLLGEYGPSWQADSGSKKTKDESGSGAAYRFALDCVAKGIDADATRAAFDADTNGAGDWWSRTTDRERDRVIENAAQRVKGEQAALLDMLPEDATPEEEPDDALFFADQDGVIRAFTAKHKDDLRFDHTAGSWFKWDGNCWRAERTKLAHHYARRMATRMAKRDPKAKALLSVPTWEAVERGARTVRQFAVTSEHWNRDMMLLGTPGGTVDLRTGELRPGNPSDHVSRLTAVAPIPRDQFDPARDCPKWLAFLNEALDGDAEAIRFLQMWGGYSLTGVTKEQALVFVHGVGGSGKSTSINTMADILSEYAINVATSTLTAAKHDAHPEEIARLDGARMAWASETEKGRAWAENRVKSLTGGDKITARFMRQDSFEFTPQMKLVIVGNNAPSLTTVDEAIKRRFIILPFDHPPKHRDNDLPAKLQKEWPGILAWMIEGCLDWQANGLIRPEVARKATESYFETQDTFQQWLEECCTVGENAADSNDNLWASWQTFAYRHGEEPGNRIRAFPETLLQKGFAKIRDRFGIRGRGFKGLRVNDSTATGLADEML